VAGGFLRDSLLGFAPKDIDIFITTQPKPVPKMAEVTTLQDLSTLLNAPDEMEAKLTTAIGVPMRREYNLSYANMEVRCVYTSTPENGELPIQVIELDKNADPVARVAEHDFGLCQVWSGGFGLEGTAAFARDQANKTCTLVHCESEAEHKRSIRRWQRLKEKLVGYVLVDETQWVGMH
jgi:hypothetical protein